MSFICDQPMQFKNKAEEIKVTCWFPAVLLLRLLQQRAMDVMTINVIELSEANTLIPRRDHSKAIHASPAP
jgi:hypothetical protein